MSRSLAESIPDARQRRDFTCPLPSSVECNGGELDDFNETVRAHRLFVFRYILSKVNDVDLAECLTQDCFLRAYIARSSYRGDSQVRTWLTAIAMNLLRDHTRTKKSRFWRLVATSAIDVSELRERIPSRQRSPETAALIQEQLRGVWNAVDQLSERQRRVFLMRYEEEMSLSEIVGVTGLSIGMVKSSLHRGIKVLRSHCRTAPLRLSNCQSR